MTATVFQTKRGKFRRSLILAEDRRALTLLRELMQQRGSDVLGIVGVTAQAQRLFSNQPNDEILRTLSIAPTTPMAALPALILRHQITDVIFAITMLSRKLLALLIDTLPPKSVRWHVIPEQLHTQHALTMAALRPLLAADLIGRRTRKANTALLTQTFHRSTVLVTGAGGSIGSELVTALLYYPLQKILAIARSEHSLYTLEQKLIAIHGRKHVAARVTMFIGDVRDKARLLEIILAHKIDCILHTAAHKHVPLMESNEKEAIKNNVLATETLLQAARQAKIPSFVLVSTDKAVVPESVMGASKKLAEYLVHHYGQNNELSSAVVRLGNVISSRGSVIPLFTNQIAAGGPVTVTHPATRRYFMTRSEAALLVVTIGAFTLTAARQSAAAPGKTYLFKMGVPVRVDALIRRMIRLSGYMPERDIRITYIGLRPGEKLNEILYDKSCKLHKTSDPNILELEDPDALPTADTLRTLSKLQAQLPRCSAATVRKTLNTLGVLHKNYH